MNGRVYAQRGSKSGWIMTDRQYRTTKRVEDVRLTHDVFESCVMDVDSPPAFYLLNAMIEQGYYILIGNVRISCQTARPSASPFSPVV